MRVQLENTQLDIKEEIRKLSDEIMDVRSESGATNDIKKYQEVNGREQEIDEEPPRCLGKESLSCLTNQKSD